eukprot:9676556-Lingulodinium_polyedra.AAC.1
MQVIANAFQVPRCKACRMSRPKLWTEMPNSAWNKGFLHLASVVFSSRQKVSSTGKAAIFERPLISRSGSARLGINRSFLFKPSSGKAACNTYPWGVNCRRPNR